MFSVGQFIVYGTTGVCKIEEIGTLEMTGINKDKIYYTMSPISSKGSKVYVLVNSEKAMLRPIITREEAEILINEIPNIEHLWVDDEKRREEIYKQAYRSCDCREWIKIIKTLYLRKMSRIAEGKKVTVVDGKYLYMAEERLYEELGMALGMNKDEVIEYITKCVEGCEDTSN